MSPNKSYLDNLRSKSNNTKNVLAAVFAILPALLVGYAQFYMNDRTTEKNFAATTETSPNSDTVPVSAIASMGKIFSEGKASLGDALNQLEKVDEKVLKPVPVEKKVDESIIASGTIKEKTGDEITKTIE